jgi:hypothetical protein
MTAQDIAHAAATIARAKRCAKTPRERDLVRDCERALTAARLHAARESVAPILRFPWGTR